jgi:NADPH2:quinone reductase
MRAIEYTAHGGPEVLTLVERPIPEPAAGEVRVRVHVSGVNPTDWKRREASRGGALKGPEVPNQDGAGVVDAVGPGVDAGRVGERVWLWLVQWHRPDGTAQDFVVIPARQAVALPEGASLDLGASLGVPALTAHRALTVASGGPARLAAGVLAGRTVLVAGGAGAVGNAAIQLARWAGARVVATVSGAEKAALAAAAGAQHVVNYRDEDAIAQIRAFAPEGVELVVEVAPAGNAALDLAVLAPGGTVAYYATDGDGTLSLPAGEVLTNNYAWHGLLLYTITEEQKDAAVADVSAAVAAGALRIGAVAGLPLHRFPLERTADAHRAVQDGAVGKVLIDLV